MKTQQIYIADDGTRFDDKDKCLKYESQCQRIDAVMNELRPKPEDQDCNFENGGGYLQQSESAVMFAYYALLEVAREVVGSDIVARTIEAGGFLPWSIIGRYIDDSGHRSLYAAWHRLMNLDDQWREWGQGYYATHPSEGKQIAL